MPSARGPTRKGGQPSTGFESLAPEILISIIKQLSDLISLDSVLRASPSSFRLFEDYGTEIMDTVISSGEHHGHIRAMIRISALIRTSKLPMNNLREFREKTTIAAMHERIRSLRIHLSPLKLATDTSPAILRGILASNRHITNLGLRLIKTYLERFRERRPCHLAMSESLYPKDLEAFLNIPKDQIVEDSVRDVGDPSWEEEQRVVRAFWRIQTIHDVKRAASNGLLLGWSEKDINEIKDMTLSKFYDARCGVQGSHGQLGSEPHPEYHELTSIAEYLREDYGIVELKNIHMTSCLTPPYPPVEVQREWSIPPAGVSQFQPWEKGMGIYLRDASLGCYFYYHQFRASFKGRIPFEEFGRLGFAFWGAQRMASYGLLPPVLGSISDGGCTFKWCMMLSEEVLKKCASRSKEDAVWWRYRLV